MIGGVCGVRALTLTLALKPKTHNLKTNAALTLILTLNTESTPYIKEVPGSCPKGILLISIMQSSQWVSG